MPGALTRFVDATAVRRAFVIAVALSAACSGDPPPQVLLPEPTQALRPVAVTGSIPAQARVVDYSIDARLDAVEHRIEANERVVWRNPGPYTVAEIPLHLYMNGFRAEDTAWMRGARGSHRGQGQDAAGAWGFLDVRAIRIPGPPGDDAESPGVPLRFAEAADPSLMTVTLPEPVGPGESITLEIDFVTQLPRVFARTGFAGQFHMVGQWFPKIGVLERDGGWQAHVFTIHSEFYADFGHYDVRLDVPEAMVVGATGIRTDERVEAGRKHLTYHAEMVHDFAWTASPEFVEHHAEHEGIRIRQLLQPEHAHDAPAHRDAVVQALDSMQTRFGPYPWSTITVVHPPQDGGGAGGMEYPTLFTTSDIRTMPGLARRLGFEERASGRFTTIHEFGHQYFQGLFASNEHRQPWLDEGMNTMSNVLTMLDAHGEEALDGDAWIFKIAGHPVTVLDGLRLTARRSGGLDPIDQPADAFAPEVGSYSAIVYRKTAAVMLTLRNLVGHDAFDRALRTYGERYRFRHPKGGDLEDTLVEVIGAHPQVGPEARLDLRRYLDEAMRTTLELDVRIHRVTNRPAAGEAGWHRDDAGALVGGDLPKTLVDEDDDPDAAGPDDADLEGVVIVHHGGGLRVPVDIRIEFGDGSTEDVVWDGAGRTEVLTFPGRRVVWAHCDPDRKLLLEARRYNNAAYAPGPRRPDPAADGLGRGVEGLSLLIWGGLGP